MDTCIRREEGERRKNNRFLRTTLLFVRKTVVACLATSQILMTNSSCAYYNIKPWNYRSTNFVKQINQRANKPYGDSCIPPPSNVVYGDIEIVEMWWFFPLIYLPTVSNKTATHLIPRLSRTDFTHNSRT